MRVNEESTLCVFSFIFIKRDTCVRTCPSLHCSKMKISDICNIHELSKCKNQLYVMRRSKSYVTSHRFKISFDNVLDVRIS